MRSHYATNDRVSATALDAADGTVAYVQAKNARFITELKAFIRFPSISAQPEHAGEVKRCAVWLADHVRRIGMERVTVVPTARHPIVYGEWCRAPGRPTVLIYGHYDVQPVDPLSEWRSPPFEPIVRGNALYGRGASDDKGQLFVHVKALEALLQTSGELPVNVKCLFEGEEEIGSPNLAAFLDRYRDALAADVAVLSDTRMLAPHRPAITYGLRGALGLELEVRGAGRDLHAGNFGGAVRNPLQTLCEIIARLHDGEGRVAIPGFYYRVKPATAAERACLAEAAPSDDELLKAAAAEQGWGRTWFQPLRTHRDTAGVDD
jgi:acetylornithine deacetylase/succinyl-diaminopimelate desuccinylase-like protein